MTSLVLAEHNGHHLSEITARIVTAAAALGAPVHVLVVGSGCQNIATEAARLSGVEAVLVADDPLYAHPLAETLTAQILALEARYDAFLAGATSLGKAVMPRLAALLDIQQVSEITRVLSPTRFERPVYAGALIATVETPPGKQVLTVRPTAFAPTPTGGSALLADIAATADPGLSIFVRETVIDGDRPDLSTAKIIVSGGRGLQSQENFSRLARIAERLKAALGGSRAAVDAGFLSNACQIGQTGKVVAPKLYIAAGISGAIQHLAGMKDSAIIVAINSDEEAAIFKLADFGLVADLAQALPELDAELARRGYN